MGAENLKKDEILARVGRDQTKDAVTEEGVEGVGGMGMEMEMTFILKVMKSVDLWNAS